MRGDEKVSREGGLHDKIAVCEHVIPHEDASDVSDALEDQAARHGNQIAPGLVADAQEDLRQQAEGKDGGEEGVAGQRRKVGHVSENVALNLERTCARRAELGVCQEGLVEVCQRGITPVGHSRCARHCGGVVLCAEIPKTGSSPVVLVVMYHG